MGRYHSSTGIALTSIVATTLAAYTLNKTAQILTERYGGYSGFLRLIWEGDHLPPHIRDAIDELEILEEKSIRKEKKKLEKIELAIEVAKLNSVDEDEDGYNPRNPTYDNTNSDNGYQSTADKEIKLTDHADYKHYILIQTPSLVKDVSAVSFSLDNICAQVDSIPSYSDPVVKRRKKQLSNDLVRLMERVDEIISICGIVVR